MKKEIDIHDHQKKLESALRLLEKATISEKNKQLILEFKDYGSLNGIGLPRMVRYLGVLRDLAKILQVDFDKATKKDIMHTVRIIQEDKDYSPWTKSIYKIMLKRFYKWLKGIHSNKGSFVCSRYPTLVSESRLDHLDCFHDSYFLGLRAHACGSAVILIVGLEPAPKFLE